MHRDARLDHHADSVSERSDSRRCVALTSMAQPTSQPQPQSPPPAAAGPTRPGLVRVARIAGVPVYLTFSWLLLAVLITIGYGSYVGGGNRSVPVTYLLGFGIVVCLVVSVLLHELGHAFMARRYGVGVRGITLELLGGFTEMDRDAPSPRSEAAIALAGPGVSLVLAVVGGLALPITERGTVLGDLGVPVRGQQRNRRGVQRPARSAAGRRTGVAGRRVGGDAEPVQGRHRRRLVRSGDRACHAGPVDPVVHPWWVSDLCRACCFSASSR